MLNHLIRLCLVLGVGLAVAGPVAAQESALRRLNTGDDSRGWNGVGRLNIGDRSFCTGALIAPNLVLTAAHCLFDRTTGARIDPGQIEFLAGWRNDRAEAYRGVRRAVAHPQYVYGGGDKLARVAYDLALLELDQPIRLSSVRPFETDPRPERGDEVGIVSYAKDRSEAPSLQEVCHVLEKEPELLILSCSVDFGSSGAPIFSVRGGIARVVAVVSSKAELAGQPVALGTSLLGPLETLRAALEAESNPFQNARPGQRVLETGAGTSAKFLRP